MVYVGMDVSSKGFMVLAINSKKRVVFKGEIASTRGGLRRLIEGLGPES